jgi:hypothetical protein
MPLGELHYDLHRSKWDVQALLQQIITIITIITGIQTFIGENIIMSAAPS